MILGIVDTRSGAIVYGQGGHNPPILVGEDGTAEYEDADHEQRVAEPHHRQDQDVEQRHHEDDAHQGHEHEGERALLGGVDGLRRERLRRLHRKIAVIDARIAFVGGINIIDDMHTPNQVPPRFDYAVRVEGPLLAPIHAAVVNLWTLVMWTQFRRRGAVTPLEPQVEPCGTRRGARARAIRRRRQIRRW